MSAIGIVILGVLCIAMLAAPRRWAMAPLVGAACFLTLAGFEIGSIAITGPRAVIACGAIRVAVRREFPNRFLLTDGLYMLLALSVAGAAVFRKNPAGTLIFNLGFAYDALGLYFLFRCFLPHRAALPRAAAVVAVALSVVSLCMIYEWVALSNVFSALGGVPAMPAIRDGRVRASGPFAHPILAGTAGAAMLPVMAVLWRSGHRLAIPGTAACLAMIATSGSSGPILAALVSLAALACWKLRNHMAPMRWTAIGLYAVLEAVMKVPAYYIIGRFDLTGSSTGWHRAELIHSSLDHLKEWWAFGTDYTRHWMPTGVTWSPNHTDITNYYVHLGVIGGLAPVLIFLGILSAGFAAVGRGLENVKERSNRFALWAFGSALFSHAMAFLSVSYFDQSVMFFHLTMAGAVSGLAAGRTRSSVE